MAFQDAAKGRNHAQGDVMEGRAPRQRHDSGDLAIRIARDGTWYYRGSPIARKEMVCLSDPS